MAVEVSSRVVKEEAEEEEEGKKLAAGGSRSVLSRILAISFDTARPIRDCWNSKHGLGRRWVVVQSLHTETLARLRRKDPTAHACSSRTHHVVKEALRESAPLNDGER